MLPIRQPTYPPVTELDARNVKPPPFTSFDNLLQGGDLTLTDLDAVSTDHPILVYYINMHTAAANSAALAAAKIPADIGDLPGGGRFGRDASGKLDGMIYEETALKKFAVAIPKITPAPSALEFTRGSLRFASSPLVGEDRGGGSRRPKSQASGGRIQ